jgi:cell division protein ZapA
MEKTIRVTILGRPYPLRVDEQHEGFTTRLAAMVEERAREVESHAPGHTPLTHMALTALSLGEELLTLRDELESLRQIEDQADVLASRLDAALDNGEAKSRGRTKKPRAARKNPSRASAVPSPSAAGSAEDVPDEQAPEGALPKGDEKTAGATSTKSE